MDQDLQKQLQEQAAKINAIYVSVEKTRKYFRIIMWITIIMVVLPLIGLVFAIPAFIETYTSTFEGLL